MNDYLRDPVINVVHNQIKGGIRVCFENECLGSAVILIYSGIDTMAYLRMPEGQTENTAKDFIEWCDMYMEFRSAERLAGEELYSARCGMLHSHSADSRRTRSGQCRTIGYVSHDEREILFDGSKRKDVVIVSIYALADAFFRGADNFLVDAYASPGRRRVVEERFKRLVHMFPTKQDAD